MKFDGYGSITNRVAAMIVVVAWASSATVAFAHDNEDAPGDPLSGHYRSKDDPQDANGDLRVVADGDGWQAWFGNAPRRLDPVTPEEVLKIFPEVVESLPQCAASAQLLLCRVAPGTHLPGGAGMTTTGYMATIVDVGSFELVRVP